MSSLQRVLGDELNFNFTDLPNALKEIGESNPSHPTNSGYYRFHDCKTFSWSGAPVHPPLNVTDAFTVLVAAVTAISL